MIRILIADDEELEREALKAIIGNISGVRLVGEATNGREAIELDNKFNPHIIIMDIKMPGIDGLKGAKIIKQNDENKNIIMVTAHDDFELIRNALVIGVYDYILKPINPIELTNTIEKIVQKCIEKNYDENIILDESPIEKSIQYIKTNINKTITLDTIAAVCNLSPCYFSKIFKEEMGVTFVNYINNERIEKAKELLLNTDRSILNIAWDIGFEDCGYFIRVFKKITGLTPKRFREKTI
ncbi:response regulator transcription factor [Clostridium tarantellae]|uniref:Stage 0 sporulation protein A homolog n=1 Tax=Clostridium tarantellae TaxID=39493 RepID=A0A6I1MIH8_9CLOT|nr:response regulator [Clostridium tarantellae]MPQ43346.1 response regulator [Clostridium tarantellae]